MIENPYQSPATTESVDTAQKPALRSIIIFRIASALFVLGGMLAIAVRLFPTPDDRFRLDWCLQDLLGGTAVLGGLIAFGFARRIYNSYLNRMKGAKPADIHELQPKRKQG